MNKLLLIVLLLGPWVLKAQDPELINKDGSPVSVPSRTESNYNKMRDSRLETPSNNLPSTRQNTLNPEGLSSEERGPVYYNDSYRVGVQPGDTTRIYFFDADGKPIKNMNKLYGEALDGNEVDSDSISGPLQDSVDTQNQPPSPANEDR